MVLVMVERVEKRRVVLREGVISGAQCVFDLIDGTVVRGIGSIISVGNGWYRCVIEFSSIGSVQVFSANNNDSGISIYTGDGTSGIYIWGAQLEVGSSASAYQRVIDGNSWDGVMTDATQTTSTSQPHLGNIIAPNERPSLKNPNGQSNYLTHPTISFAANQAWTVHTVVCLTQSIGLIQGIFGSTSTSIRITVNGLLNIVNDDVNNSNTTNTINKFLGKYICLSLVAKGDGVIKIYINSTFVEDVVIVSKLSFSQLLQARVS